MVTEPALSCTTLASSRIGAMASEASEHSSPTTMCGLSWSSTRFTVLVACSGLHAESSYCTCSLVPLTFDLSCSRARSMPSLPITPKYEPGPEMGISTPMRITRSWASAPNAKAAASAAKAVLISGFMKSPSSRRCGDCTTRQAPNSAPGAILLADLRVEGPQVVEHAEQEHAAGHEIEDAGEPLAHVEAVDAEQAEEGEQDPGDVVADRARRVPELRRALHPGDEEQVDQPADAEQPEREEPDRARDRPAEVEAVRAGEAEDPQEVADQLAVRVRGQDAVPPR